MSVPSIPVSSPTGRDDSSLWPPELRLGGGSMGEQLRALDWAATPLGPPQSWPQSLRTAVSLMLDSGHPKFIAWGPALISLFNDAYAPILGGKLVGALGRPFPELWAELWPQVEPIVGRALAGEASWHEDMRLVLERHGYPEEAYFSFSYSPIRDERGAVAGMLCTCVETTAKVRALSEVREAEAALRRGEQRVEMALEAAGGVALWERDLREERIYGDARWARLYGWEPERVKAGLTPEEVSARIHPEDRAEHQERLSQAIREGGLSSEFRILRPDGQLRWAMLRARVIRDAQGEPLHLLGATIDITERKLTEQALFESREQLNTIFSQASVGISLNDPQGRFLLVNDRFCEILGRRREEILHRPMQEFTHPDELAANLERLRRPLDTGEPFVIENRCLRPDGRTVWVNVHVAPTHDAHGRATALVGVAQDVTEHREAQESLRRLNADLEAVVEERTRERDRLWSLSKDPMVIAGFDGSLIAANPACRGVLGYSARELRRLGADELVHPEDRALRRQEMDRLRRGEPVLRSECRYRHKDGSYRWISWTAVPDEDRIHAIGRDVTQEKEAAAALRQAEEALRQAQKMEAVGQLTGGIAHDFNNLLLGISGSLGLAQRRIAQGRPEEVGRFLELATESANRAAALTHRLLAFARRQPLDPKPTAVNALVTGLADLLRRTLGEGVRLELALAETDWPALCDAHQLESAILNLAINARDAMPAGGILRIETSNARFDNKAAAQRDIKPGEYVCLCVTDTGTGMPPEVIARAFDPFFTTKSIGQGTGLGLSMVYGFIRQSEGFVRIDSELGEGTTVTLYLPRSREPGEARANARRPAEPPAAGREEVVLVVEDKQTVRALVVEVLRELGYRTLEAADGEAGLALLRSGERIDLLVSDVGLPCLDGRQMAKAARSHRPALKVLLMTGYAPEAAGGDFLLPGMELITKPFEVETLAARVRAMVEG